MGHIAALIRVVTLKFKYMDVTINNSKKCFRDGFRVILRYQLASLSFKYKSFATGIRVSNCWISGVRS